jgi:hypothetical protein
VHRTQPIVKPELKQEMKQEIEPGMTFESDEIDQSFSSKLRRVL